MASMFNAVSEPDAIGLLKQDHRKVEELFKQFEQSKDGDEKIELAQQICQELTIHATVEEREFYPKLLDAFDEDGDDLIKEAEVEHATLKMLIAEIDGSTSDDRLFDANVKVLKEYVQHHVKEEENEIMPKARSADVDLQAIGERIQKLKERLTSQMMEAADGRSARGKARVRVAKPGGRSASKRSSRSTGARKSASRRSSANGSRANGSSASSRGGNGRSSGRGAAKSSSRGSAARGNGRGGSRSASSRSTGSRSASGRGGSRGGASSRGGSSSRGGRGSSSSRASR
ncbi:MAG TPA: hemerythrin domain-containing protein [Xanthomonadales bacterium]|nr:hemerythrin domain-containing protein [Xanthomonadales bacterium]